MMNRLARRQRVGLVGGFRLVASSIVLMLLAAWPGQAEPPATHPVANTTGALPTTQPATPGISKELQEAISNLPKADVAGRKAIYDQIAQKGDSTLIPLLKAYRDGSLQLREGTLTVYGERTDVAGRGSMLPLLDALSGQAVRGADGQPQYFARPDLSKAIKSPPRSERPLINELISSLALLDPNPAVRIRSIQDVGERATRALIDPEALDRLSESAARLTSLLKDPSVNLQTVAETTELNTALAALASDRADDTLFARPGTAATSRAVNAAAKVQEILVPTATASAAVPLSTPVDPRFVSALASFRQAASAYRDLLDQQEKTRSELPTYLTALTRQMDNRPHKQFVPALREAKASLEVALGDKPARLSAIKTLGEVGTSRAENVLRKLSAAADRGPDAELAAAARSALEAARGYQTRVRFVQNTFAGLSLGSILVLLALGLSIVFGLMGVINMAHGEFMMIGAFTTYMVSEAFKQLPAGWFDWYPLAAVPAAFLVASFVGLLCEWFVIRHLYGRPLETLLATWGVSIVLIQIARVWFGDNLSVKPPSWMEGGVEIAPDLTLPLNRVYIVVFCLGCILAVFLLVNRTKLGLLLRATTQNRDMAAALGVPTRRVDALTFAFGAGLAGLAGVAVPLYNKINPGIGQEYIVDSFMVVVVGGVGKLAGVICAGFGLGFVSKYLEPALSTFKAMASSSSVIGKVLVLAAVVVFLQWRPSGIFPPRGRLADA